MAENNDEFLKKVYDQYLGSDYEWGDADLNPKREIRKSGEEEWEEEQSAIIDTIEQRIKALQKEAANLPKFKRPEVVDNDNFLTKTSGINGGASPSNDIPLSQLKVQSALGGDLGDNLFLPKNNFDDKIDFLLNEIDGMIPSVIIQGTFPYSKVPDGVGLPPEMFNPGCDTEDETLEEFESSNPEFNKLKDALLKSDSDNEDDNYKDNEEDSAGASGGSGAAADQADKDAEDQMNAAIKAANAQEAKAKECIAKELGILQSILALLKVINVLKKVLLLILSIVVPVVKMIAFAAQCWINPPAAAQVAQMVAEKIAALLMSVIGEIIQMIWDLLDMDCMTEQVQKVLDEINETLSGVDSVLSVTNNLISFGMKQYDANKKSLIDSFTKFADKGDKFNNPIKEYGNKDAWKKAGDTFEESFVTSIFGKDGIGENGVNGVGLKNILSAAIPSDIKSAINNLMDSTQGILERTNDILGKAKVKDTVVNATITDMTDFLGPIRIK